MGLDMFLNGSCFSMMRERIRKDGFNVKEWILELGYWRKHPNLHGYIVQEFGGGKDDCQAIELSVEDLKKILSASEADQLPVTSGFFFGESQPEHKAETKRILEKAIAWLEDEATAMKQEEIRSCSYRASW